MCCSSRKRCFLPLVMLSSILSFTLVLTFISRYRAAAANSPTNKPPLPLFEPPPSPSSSSSEDPSGSGLLLPSHQDAITWLHNYYKTGNPSEDRSWYSGYTNTLASVIEQTTSPPSPSPSSNSGRRKSNLVIAPVGDSWTAEDHWLSQPDIASFDIISLYHGDNVSNFTCPRCIQTIAVKGPKWRLILTLSTALGNNNNNTSSSLLLWDAVIKRQYDYVMFSDDDLVMDTSDINTLFSTMKAHDLLLSQLSVCREPGSSTWRRELLQEEDYLLRYMTFIEVMAPAFRMDFFTDVVRHTMSAERTWVGWGLDSVWPALLHYPKDRVAVIDAACMSHPPSTGVLGSTVNDESSLYRPGLSPITAKQEEMVTFAAFKYTGQTTAALGEGFMSCRVVGHVRRPLLMMGRGNGGGVGGGGNRNNVGKGVVVVLCGMVVGLCLAGAMMMIMKRRRRRAAWGSDRDKEDRKWGDRA